MRALVLLACLACAREMPELRQTCSTDVVMKERPPPRVFGIAAVKLRVSSLPRAQAFYNDFLGFPWRYDTPTAATVAINERQRVELEVGPLGPDGRLVQVILAADQGSGVLDPDQHAIILERSEPPGSFLRPGAERIATHVAHVGVLVGGLEASLRFYRDLRFQETWRGSADGQHLSWVNLRVPDGDDYLELMLFDQRPPPDQMGGKHHLCLSTPNIAYAVAVLESRRGEYARPIEIKVGRNGKGQANLFDPDGTRVELMEPVTADRQPVPPSAAPPPRP
jgi:catechol 2,3-dioxygenase-like lactoylglutathione lyase family enzyme